MVFHDDMIDDQVSCYEWELDKKSTLGPKELIT